MCQFKNEFAIVVIEKSLSMKEIRDKVKKILENLASEQVVIFREIPSRGPSLGPQRDATFVFIMYGRFANAVVREALAEEIRKPTISVSQTEKEALVEIIRLFPELEFFDQNIASNASFMEKPVSIHREGDIG